MKRVIIVQARMASTRLPGKVLADLAGRPLLAQQIRRLRSCRCMEEIVVATTAKSSDDPVVELARCEGVRWFRGSEEDVLSRYVGAAREARAELVVRITSDCPLIDPAWVDRVIEALEVDPSHDYASNVLRRTFPRGLDTEVFFRDTLERVCRMAVSPSAREHVTWFIHRERPDLFSLCSVCEEDDNSDLRWTVDTPEDLAAMRRIYTELGLAERILGYREILEYIRRNPDISAMNRAVNQKNA